MRLRRVALPFLLFLASACAGPATTVGPATTDRVEMPRSYLFSPGSIVVPVGTTVTWTNSDQFTHTVRIVETGEVVGTAKPGETITYTFATPGTYAYDCSLHPQNMKGTVTVR